jgi:LPPG:FO 2-phospho-L-lactate transferase
LKVTVLTGGVGGARFVRALAETLPPADVTAIVNVGDDLDVFGLHVSPDLDSVLYALAGLGDEERGWGRSGETWRALESATQLGADAWFRLGDLDLGLHLARAERLARGEPLSDATAALARAAGVETTILPATDDALRTRLETPAGSFEFQDWFVRRGHRDEVDAVRFEGSETAAPAPGVLAALADADLLAIAPSNPYVSIWPILAVGAVREALEQRSVPCVGVSPLIGGRAVKGPADRMLARMAGGTSPAHVAGCYDGLLDALVVDEADSGGDAPLRTIVTQTLMTDAGSRRRVAEAVLDAAGAPA